MGVPNAQTNGWDFTIQLQARTIEEQHKLITALRLQVAVLKQKLEKHEGAE